MKKNMGRNQRTDSRAVNHDILYGVNPVTEALNAGRRRIYEIFLAGDRASDRIAALEDLAQSLSIPLTRVNAAELTRMAGNESHQNVAARVSLYPFADLEDVLGSRGQSDEPPFILILDGIEDPQNLGALARTALGAGVDGILIPKDRAAQPTPAAIKASAGALEHIRLACVTNLAGTIKELKKEGFWITGLDAEAGTSLYENDFSSATALVVGGEGRGVRDLVKKHCDYLVFIPQAGPLNSLNASVAGALSMYEVVRQRQK